MEWFCLWTSSTVWMHFTGHRRVARCCQTLMHVCNNNDTSLWTIQRRDERDCTPVNRACKLKCGWNVSWLRRTVEHSVSKWFIRGLYPSQTKSSTRNTHTPLPWCMDGTLRTRLVLPSYVMLTFPYGKKKKISNNVQRSTWPAFPHLPSLALLWMWCSWFYLIADLNWPTLWQFIICTCFFYVANKLLRFVSVKDLTAERG